MKFEGTMFTNYLKIALRNLLRQKVYSLINITGLAVGIACCIVIVLYVHDELSFDTFNANADRVYRPTLLGAFQGKQINSAQCPAGMGPALSHDLPELAAYTRIRNFGGMVLRFADKVFSEERFLGADSSFFDVFTVHFLEGNPKTALTQPQSVVLTQAMAKKYFGDVDPVGKVLNTNGKLNWTVTGVMEDWPKNSHLKFDFLGSLTTSDDSRNTTWLSNNYLTYLLLRKGTNIAEFQQKLDSETVNYASPQMKKIAGISLEQFRAGGNSYGYFLQPLSSIHLHSHLDYEQGPNGDISYVYIFSALALAILLIACINFINLATARSERRAREVGIRKTLGSNRLRLVGQFLAESILMSVIAVLLAIILVEVLLPLFNDIAGKEMSLSLFSSPLTVLLLLFFATVVGAAAGSYPAFYLSSFRPMDVLAKNARRRWRKPTLRSGLVTFQFAVSIVLFIGTFVIHSQLRYIQTRNLGFDKEQLIVIERTNDLAGRLQAFEQELRSNPRILNLTNSTAIPGTQGGDGAYQMIGIAGHQFEDLREMWCDYDFADTYRLKILEGRFFSKEHASDTVGVVANEAVERAYGEKNIVGRYLAIPGPTPVNAQKYEIIGVTNDFNFQSLHESIRPLIMHFLSRNNLVGQFITVRLSPGDPKPVLSFLEGVWKSHAGNEGFSYNFLDQNLERLYAAERRTSKIAATFSILAVFIASLGLLGLAAYVTERKTKEIGIRKVLGASVSEILRLLWTEFAKWILIANVIAWPVAYYIMDKWLQDFAYRVDIGLWVFVFSGALALIIAFLAVGSYAIRAALSNPVEALRYE